MAQAPKELLNAMAMVEDLLRELPETDECDAASVALPLHTRSLLVSQIHQIWSIGFGHSEYATNPHERGLIAGIHHGLMETLYTPATAVVCASCIRALCEFLLTNQRRVRAEMETHGCD